MKLNIKNLFKKICVLGASATMALGLCAPLASATPPTSGTSGQLFDDFAFIKGSNTSDLIPILSLNKDAVYQSDAPISLINNSIHTNGMSEGVGVKENTDGGKVLKDGSNDTVNVEGTGITLYLRAAGNGISGNQWVLVWKDGQTIHSTTNDITPPNGIAKGIENLTGTKGKYNIYYYIDGNGIYYDTTT